MKHRKKIQEPTADKVFNVCNMIFLFLSFVLVAYPLLYIVSASLSDSSAVIRGEVWLFPVGFELKAYKAIFTNKMIMTGYLNSILYTVLGTCFNLFLTTPWPPTRCPGKAVRQARAHPGSSCSPCFFRRADPQYILMNDLHLMNTIWAIVISGGISIYNMIVMRSFLQSSIPEDLYEAAYLDGCGDIRILFDIVLPPCRSRSWRSCSSITRSGIGMISLPP